MPSERLPCGVAVNSLLEQVAEGSPVADATHQLTCPHCRAALTELTELWSPVRSLAAEQVRAPAGLVTAVMRRVRELAENAWHAVLEGDRGSTRLAAWVIGAIARLSAQQVPRVTMALGQGVGAEDLSPADIAGRRGEAGSHVGVAGRRAVIDLDIAVEMGANIADLAERVRRTVGGSVTRLTGVTVAEVNITVVDVVATNE